MAYKATIINNVVERFHLWPFFCFEEFHSDVIEEMRQFLLVILVH